MKVLSLFDGISCGMIALERANIEVKEYYASEIDKHAIKISNKNYPNIIRLGDITKIDNKILLSLPKIDLILGGSPCQGFSRNGNMLNFNDPQSKLFFDFVRILNWIKENNNKEVKFLLENVEMKKEWEEIISQYLDVKPISINSKLVSAQNRPRTYWTNIPKVKLPIDKNITLKDILINFDLNKLVKHQGILVDKTFTSKELSLINVVNTGVNNENEVHSAVHNEVRITQATKQGYIVAEDGDGINLSFPNSKTRRGRVIKQKSNTLDKQCNICVYYNGILRKLVIEELEKLQTLPVGYTSNLTEAKRKSLIGNGWTVDVISHILKNL